MQELSNALRATHGTKTQELRAIWDQPSNPVFHFCDLLVYSSGPDNVHSVSRNSGERVSLIMFFGGSESE